ncbi:MAG: Gfo/Idh/MocA family oxidoreductase [Pirellulales bacterium]|nr:Gfo/Idh/MocA family oxidoreductase [Pirellulales bacterium]
MASTARSLGTHVSRRQALKAGAAALAAGRVLRVRPTSARELGEKLRVAAVGVANKGGDDLANVATAKDVRIVALCDVDANYLGAAAQRHQGARRFADYRRMLDEAGPEIDAVIVGTPDHMHGAIAIAAMSLGKHVYVEKPLAHNLAELRRMATLAAEKNLVTQMGTQIHSDQSYRTAVEMLRQGTIGKIREAHSWIGGSLSRPATAPPEQPSPVPPTLDWDLWQGVAQERPYAEGLYHPFHWRAWRDYGGGTLGDMGCHLFDPIFTALELEAPIAVHSAGPAHSADLYAADADVRLSFASTPYTTGEFTIRWTHGSIKPDASPAQLPPDAALPGNGSFVVGERGVMVLPHWSMPTFYRDGVPLPGEVKSAGSRNHYHEWADACRGEGATSTPFSYAAKVTEAVLVGKAAGDFPGQDLKWNSSALEFDNPEATERVHRQYREGWRPAGV